MKAATCSERTGGVSIEAGEPIQQKVSGFVAKHTRRVRVERCDRRRVGGGLVGPRRRVAEPQRRPEQAEEQNAVQAAIAADRAA